MSELTEIVLRLERKLDQQGQDIRHLQMLLMKGSADSTWIDEKIAAGMLNLKPRSLRESVKNRKGMFMLIDYRHTNNRNFQYRRKDVQRYMELTSTQPDKKLIA